MAETYFKKTFRGYSPEQVDSFIISLNDTYESNIKSEQECLRDAQSENNRLKDELEELRKYMEETAEKHKSELLQKQEEYDRLVAQIGEKMVLADNRAAEIIRNAEKEALLIAAEAKKNSELEAEKLRSDARREAEKLIDDTRMKCADISAKAEEFRLKQDEMHKSISETEKRFDDALAKLREGFGGI